MTGAHAHALTIADVLPILDPRAFAVLSVMRKREELWGRE